MGIKYISKINDKTWKVSTTKSGKSVKNFKTEKEAIKYAQQLHTTEAIIIKKNNAWKQYSENTKDSSKDNSKKTKTAPKKVVKSPSKSTKKTAPKSSSKTNVKTKSTNKAKSTSPKVSKSKSTESESLSKNKKTTAKKVVKKTSAKKNDLSEEKLNESLRQVAPEIISALKNSDVELTAEQKLATKLSKKQPSDIVREQNYMAIALSCFIIFNVIGLIFGISWLII